MRFSVKKIDKSKRLHYTKSVKKIRIHQGGKSHGESIFQGTKTETEISKQNSRQNK